MHTQQIDEKVVFNTARQIADAAARDEYLAEAGGDNQAAIERIRLLLRIHDEEQSFLESPAVDLTPTTDLSPIAEQAGTVIGSYKLLQQIGEGGMGVVFMAEQTEPIQRTVALKIIKPGMDTRQVIARFEAERQALAMMDHPNIAKVLDAGTTVTSRPYFVMELVKGIPITKYCDDKQFSLRERLRLLLPVCQAVQHAHQKGIIHRDLKPTNVLVAEYDSHAVPKVIDFGVAKATAQKLTERTMFTEFGQVVGTVEYMSPEQAKFNQLDIDTRSDIYSLGVLLYELLTGSTPFERERLREAAFDEVLRIIREEEPPKPSTRLSTSETLPSIAANRHTEPSRLSKDVRGELDWIVMKCLEKDRNRRYETANGLVRDIERYLHDEPVQACPPSAAYRFRKFARRNKAALAVASAAIIVLLVLVAGLAISNQLIAAQRAQAEAERQRAEENLLRARMAVKDILFDAALGRGEWAQLREPLREKFAEKLTSFYQSLVQEENSNPSLQYETAIGYRSLAALHDSLNKYEQAEKPARRAVAILDRLAAEYHDNHEYRNQQAYSYWILGGILNHLDRATEAEKNFQRAAKLYEQLISERPDVPGYFKELVPCYGALAHLLVRHGASEEAKLMIQRLVDLSTKAPAASATTPDFQPAIRTALINSGCLDDAIAAFQEVVAVKPDDPVANRNLGALLQNKGRFRLAIVPYQKAARIHPEDSYLYFNLGFCLSQNGRMEEAVDAYRQSIRINPNRALTHANLGGCLVELNKPDDAIVCWQKAIELQPDDANLYNNLAWQLVTFSKVESRDATKAVALALKATELAPGDGSAWNTLGVAQYRAGKWQDAKLALEKSMELREQGDAFDWIFLAMANWQLGHQKDAREWYGKAIEWMGKHASKNLELGRFRAEAAELLGISEPNSEEFSAATTGKPAEADDPTTTSSGTTDN